MPSQLELLRESVARLEAKGGEESPFLQGLKMQIIALENQSFRAEQRFNLGVNSSLNRRLEPKDDIGP